MTDSLHDSALSVNIKYRTTPACDQETRCHQRAAGGGGGGGGCSGPRESQRMALSCC